MMKYFMYCRKSTEDEDRQALSIDSQISDMTAIARAHGLSVIECLTESKSAKAPGRPVFESMIRRIEAGEANGILTWKLDRLARNFDDGGRLVGLLQRGVIREIRVADKTYLPSDNVLLIAVELGMANQYVRDLSANIQRGLREKVRRGIYPLKAPLGYYNHPKLRQLEPHPEKFEKLRKIFELFVTGRYTFAQIRQEFVKANLVGELSKEPPPISSLEKIFANPIYYGVFCYNGVLHEGIHKPLVSKATWDEIQKVRVRVGKGRKQFGEKGFQFLNFARCGSCGYCITGERHTKKSGRRYYYYRCTHKNKGLPCQDRVYLTAQAFEAEVKRNARLVSLPTEWKEKFLAKVEVWESEGAAETKTQIDALKAALETTRKQINQLNTGFIDGSMDISELRELKNPLTVRKVELEGKIEALERRKSTRLEPLRKWINDANAVENAVLTDDWTEMRRILEKTGSNPVLRAQALHVSFVKPWDCLAQTNLASFADNEFSLTGEKWWT